MPLPSEIQIVPLDFDTIRTELKRYLQNQTEFKDYNFEGSALSTFIDVLAYDAYYHGWYTNFAVNEVFLHTAQIRNSVVAAARQLGYTPRSMSSATAYVDVTVNGLLATEGSITLEKFTRFSSVVAGQTLSFYNIAPYTVSTFGQESVTFPGLEIYEGTLIRQSTTVTASMITDNGVNISIADPNIDTRTLIVSVRPSVDSVTAIEYTKASSSVSVTEDSTVYFLFESNDGTYEIHFGDGRLGKKLVVGQQIVLEFLVSRGADGNGAKTFVYNGGTIGELSATTDVTVALSNLNIPSIGGSERESIQSIKRTAPEIYQVQGRIVTPIDARATLLNEYSGIESISVWGGEDNVPPAYGKMFIAMKPINADKFTSIQKDIIASKILRPKSLPTLLYEFVDPDYIYIVINTEVRYSAAFTTLKPAEIGNNVKTAIINYGGTELGQFGAFFRYSALSKTIDEANQSIRSNITATQLEKRIYANTISGAYTLEFNNPLYQSSTGANTVVLSSKVGNQRFNHLGISGVLRSNCYIENEGSKIHVYRDAAELDIQGVPKIVKRLVKPEIGNIDFATGRVTLAEFVPQQITTNLIGELKIRAIPQYADLRPSKAQILRITEDSVTVTVVEDSVTRPSTLSGTAFAVSSF